jgi:hypothetical protein
MYCAVSNATTLKNEAAAEAKNPAPEITQVYQLFTPCAAAAATNQLLLLNFFFVTIYNLYYCT